MVKRKTTRITVTREEVWMVHTPPGMSAQWCEECAAEVRMVAAEQAVGLARVSARAIYRAVENQQIHFQETSDGHLFVCLSSLLHFSAFL